MKDVTITENGPFTQEVVNTFNHFKKKKAYPNEKLTKELIQIFPMSDIKAVNEGEGTIKHTIDQTTDVTGKKFVQIKMISCKNTALMIVTFLKEIFQLSCRLFITGA